MKPNFTPITVSALEEEIILLNQRLKDPNYCEEWKLIVEELQEKENLLKNFKNQQNNN